MKSISSFLLGALAFGGVAAYAVTTEPLLVKIPIRKAYIPVGFDSNDRAEVVITGILPDSCYKMGPSRAIVDADKQIVAVEQTAYLFEGYCTDMIIPFVQVVQVGMLPKGSFAVTDISNGKYLGALPVLEGSNPGIDDFHYLPVTNAHIQESTGSPRFTLVMTGNFADRCTRFKRADVHYHADVIVVQPIVERLTESNRDCSETKVRYTISVPIKDGIKGTHLLHVRSMGGQSFNTLFDFQ